VFTPPFFRNASDLRNSLIPDGHSPERLGGSYWLNLLS
jgi:hypothetical protein